CNTLFSLFFFFSSRRRHTRSKRDWSSDVCSSDLNMVTKYSIDRWHQMVADFGFGAKTGIDLPLEHVGILPDSSYFNEAFGKGKRSEERRVGKEGRARMARATYE